MLSLLKEAARKLGWAGGPVGGAAPLVPDSISLVLFRLENMALLDAHLGKAGLNHLLVTLSVRLSRSLRPEDPVEFSAPGFFALAISGRGDADVLRVVERLKEQGETAFTIAGTTVIPVLTAVVVTRRGHDLPPAQELMPQARQRADHLPEQDVGNLHLFEYDQDMAEGMTTPSFMQAMTRNEIRPWFQPQVSCHSGKITGFEALARWDHPHHGLQAPGAFLGLMTDSDLRALTIHMIRHSAQALADWDALGWHVPTISVNIATVSLSEPGFADAVLWELSRIGIEPDRLTLEILESAAPIAQTIEARTNLQTLTRAGCRIDLDDFGTGYASLDAIRHFGVHRIKIDRSFVLGCDIDPEQQRMVLAILALANRLGISVLAEGVETRDEHGFLAQMGCDEAQGYAIARPMPFEKAVHFLDEHARLAASLAQAVAVNTSAPPSQGGTPDGKPMRGKMPRGGKSA
ncbi:GGDEF domain-containing phosphodiesterase [Paracoccus sp. (in: a-proteobacteria)]|uniref:GGDEF domain-containing phosphodiesterase n=1 Tax=Paracoccus sp. TaxID=267 RepID=UPI0026DFDFFD|nr:GGDEF domain-containing phosphodiesterase [Paracoccus sp. (in: a-proteobacteria)]MDO5648104.1 GGDEF domain-containing phosphodiesterase [Paracoccus sp. (in: a-proteobacteria)]